MMTGKRREAIKEAIVNLVTEIELLKNIDMQYFSVTHTRGLCHIALSIFVPYHFMEDQIEGNIQFRYGCIHRVAFIIGNGGVSFLFRFESESSVAESRICDWQERVLTRFGGSFRNLKFSGIRKCSVIHKS